MRAPGGVLRCPRTGLLIYEFYDIENHWSSCPGPDLNRHATKAPHFKCGVSSIPPLGQVPHLSVAAKSLSLYTASYRRFDGVLTQLSHHRFLQKPSFPSRTAHHGVGGSCLYTARNV